MTEEIFQYACSLCGVKASEGDSWEHAKTLAKAEFFQFRPVLHGVKVVCDDCGSVKKMVTTDSEYYDEKGIKKI
jgi:hypothetical protein